MYLTGMKNKEKIIIGRREKANFPELLLHDIAVKIDTGAYTSSFHCHEIQEINGKLSCRFLDPDHPDYNNKEFYFDTYEKKAVKSSNGQIENRFKIVTTIELGGTCHPIALTLTDRAEMKYPVLLGRKFL
jgi:hypothetical protein